MYVCVREHAHICMLCVHLYVCKDRRLILGVRVLFPFILLFCFALLMFACLFGGFGFRERISSETGTHHVGRLD